MNRTKTIGPAAATQDGLPLYHYTVGARLEGILSEGEIRQATAFVDPKERPVVWLTHSAEWEPTCNKMIQSASGQIVGLNMIQTHERAGGLFRFEIDPAIPHVSMVEYRQQSGISGKLYRILLATARRRGSNINLWRASFDPIPAERWLGIEQWDKGTRDWGLFLSREQILEPVESE